MNEAVKGLLVLGSVGFGFSVILNYLGKRLSVEEDPLVNKILDMLPGINCGACGLSGCKAFAETAVKEHKLLVCRPAGEEINRKIASLLKLDLKTTTSLKAVSRCGADSTQKKMSNRYSGPPSCVSAHIIGGALDCKYGCLAFGDCIKVCPTKAISVDNGKVVVDIKKCIGCGKCVQACPRKLFELVPLSRSFGIYCVSCNNREKALYVRNVCSRGCISCGLCTKVDGSPFHIKNNLSYIDYNKVKDDEAALRIAKERCPTHCIDKFDV